MPVNMYYDPVRGYEIRHNEQNPIWPSICVRQLVPHPDTDQIWPGRAYLAFTEYDRKSGVGTVAFKDVENVAYYRAMRDVQGSSHLVHYHMVHGQKPILGDWKIFTGWSVQCDGSLKFNSGSMNSGLYEYHHGRYYTPIPDRQATVCEQGLCRQFLEAWRRDGRPVRRWRFDTKFLQAVRPDASKPEVPKEEVAKPEMTCVANQNHVVKSTVEDSQCCNLTSVLAKENQLMRNNEVFDHVCEDGNQQVQPAVTKSLQQQSATPDHTHESKPKPKQKPRHNKGKSWEKQEDQKKGKRQVKKNKRLDRGNTKKQKKAVIKPKRKVEKKCNQCKNTSQKPKPSRKAEKKVKIYKKRSNASRRLRSVSDNTISRTQHRQHVMYLRQKHGQVLYNLRRLKDRDHNLTTKEHCPTCVV